MADLEVIRREAGEWAQRALDEDRPGPSARLVIGAAVLLAAAAKLLGISEDRVVELVRAEFGNVRVTVRGPAN